ncbi:MAG: HAD hydrolase-like protein [Sulfurimonas sp.]|nr:HAD hydrolase-like protein [Sulfurimonas sp.]
MVKTVLWDFDGVILDSMKIKGDGFLELFKDYSNDFRQKLYKYHFENGGVSRFDKIKYFYNDVLMKDITEEEILQLAKKFGMIIKKKINDKNNLIEDSMNFIKANYTKYNFHIVSGAEHNELNNLCNYLKLTKYFITIDGSPTKKEILVKNIFDKYSYEKEQTILIGDAMTDYNASIKNGIKFYGYNNSKLKKFDYINSFNGFTL